MKTWTEKEVESLVANYNKASNRELAMLFPNKTPLAIYKKAYKMGLRKCPEIVFRNRSEANSGSNAWNWNGGVRITPSGYRQILEPSHKRADSCGYVMEHIYVFEKETGVEVPKGCCVHHLNGDKADNRIENLCLMTHGAHTAFHHRGTKHTQETREKISQKRRLRNA